jgi:hypothetical protein
MLIKIPCYHCGKPKKVTTICDMRRTTIYVSVKHGCYSCGWMPRQRHFQKLRMKPGKSPAHALFLSFIEALSCVDRLGGN